MNYNIPDHFFYDKIFKKNVNKILNKINKKTLMNALRSNFKFKKLSNISKFTTKI